MTNHDKMGKGSNFDSWAYKSSTQNPFVDWVDFDLTETVTMQEGRLTWDNKEGTLKLGLSNGSELQIGQEMPYLFKNIDTVTITDGSPVYLFSASAGVMNIKRAYASDYNVANRTIGLATQDIPVNEFGYVTIIGKVNDVDTSAWADGDFLYLSDTAGQLTNTRPASNNLIYIGMVINSNPSQGTIAVQPRILLPKFGAVLNGNYTEFEADGTMVAFGTARCWEDENFSATQTAIGADAPALTNWSTTSIKIPEFPSNITKELNLLKEYAHAGVSPGSIVPHVHIMQTTNGTGTITLYLETIIKHGATTPYINTASASVNVNGTAWNEVRLDFPTITDANIVKGTQIGMRLYRLSTDPGTFTGSVAISTWGYHYEKDMLGSRTIASK